MESVSGVKYEVTIQRADAARKGVPRSHQGVRSILGLINNLVECINRDAVCAVAGPRGIPILVDAPAIVLSAFREELERKGGIAAAFPS